MRVHVLEEVELRRRRANDEDFVGGVERYGNLVKEADCVIGVISLGGVPIRVAPDVMSWRAKMTFVGTDWQARPERLPPPAPMN